MDCIGVPPPMRPAAAPNKRPLQAAHNSRPIIDTCGVSRTRFAHESQVNAMIRPFAGTT